MADENFKFINSLFLKDLIQARYIEYDVKIKDFHIESASSNINYSRKVSSILKRIIIKYTSPNQSDYETTTMVVKVKPFKGTVVPDNLLRKEINLYTRVIPICLEIFKNSTAKLQLTPNVIYSSEKPTDVLILEDMTLNGYALEDLSIGLNLEQSKMVLEKLAFIHAASAIAINKNPNAFIDFKQQIFNESNIKAKQYFAEAMDVLLQQGSELGLNDTIVHKYKLLKPSGFKQIIEGYNSDFKGFKVLNHGNFWTNKILFKYDGNILADAVFIDFQNSFVGSPVIDLMYFLTTSVSYDVLTISKDELIYTYYETLTAVLKTFNYSSYVPSLNELQVEFLKRSSLEIMLATTIAPYLKTRDCKVIPAMYNECIFDKIDAQIILNKQYTIIKSQLQKYYNFGQLEWGIYETKIKGLVEHFQHKQLYV